MFCNLLLEGPVAANSGNIQGIVARISTLEINTTAEHATEMIAIEANQQRISELESTNNDSKLIYGNMKLRLDNLEGMYFKDIIVCFQVKVGNDQEIAQSEKNAQSKSQMGKSKLTKR